MAVGLAGINPTSRAPFKGLESKLRPTILTFEESVRSEHAPQPS